jgi:hypothetical protein
MRGETVYARIKHLFEGIRSERIRKAARKPDDLRSWTRKRIMPLHDILICILAKKGLSAVMEIRKFFEAAGKTEQGVSKQGYLKQRKKLNPEVFKLLNRDYLKQFYGGQEAKGWRGYLVLAEDGSRAEIPDSAENRQTYGKNGNQHGETVSRANINTLYDVENHFILDVGIHRVDSSELTESKEQIECLKETAGERKALVLFDRLYGSLEFINFLEEQGVKYIIRLQAGRYKAEVSGMRRKDEWVVLKHTSDRIKKLENTTAKRKQELAGKGHTLVRMVRMRFADEEQGMLLTNLKEGGTGEIQRLYGRRWKIEQKYHTLKNKMKFESVTGKASVYVQQDFWAQMLVFNIVQDLITAAQRHAARESKKKKFLYQMRINENIAIGLFKEQFISLMMTEDDQMKGTLFKQLIADMEQYIVPVRKLKSSPRKWKRMNKYKCNQKPSF